MWYMVRLLGRACLMKAGDHKTDQPHNIHEADDW